MITDPPKRMFIFQFCYIRPYPEYGQLHSPLNYHVTIFDLLFHAGLEDTGCHVFSLHPLEPRAASRSAKWKAL